MLLSLKSNGDDVLVRGSANGFANLVECDHNGDDGLITGPRLSSLCVFCLDASDELTLLLR